MKNKYIIFFLTFILILTVFIFFYFKDAKTVQDKKEVVFWTLQLSTFDKYINNVIKEYELLNPEVKIKWIDVPYSEGEKRTLSSVLTDNPPDLVNLTPDFSLLLAKRGALYTFDKDKLSDYIPSLIDSLKYDGKYFGIPFYVTSAVTLYNNRLLNKYKLKSIPKTYDDLFNISFKNNDSVYLTMINFSENDSLLKILNKYSINSPETINGEKSIKLYKEFKRIYDENLVPKESVTQTHRDALEKYMSGQLIFLVTGANFINMINENAPDIFNDTMVSEQLTGDDGLYDYSLMNFVIPKMAHNKEEALKFALFFTNNKNQVEFAKLTSILPVNKEALKDEYFINDTNGNLQTKARIISAKQLNKLQPPINYSDKKDLNTLSSNCIGKILIKNADIKETLNEFSNKWKRLK